MTHPTLQTALSVYAAIFAPATERLAFLPEQYTKQAPQRDQSRVRHDG